MIRPTAKEVLFFRDSEPIVDAVATVLMVLLALLKVRLPEPPRVMP